MRIVSWNVNGLRSVLKKGFEDWFYKTEADIACFQEIKINEDCLGFFPDCHTFFSFASKKGYSGVAVLTKNKPLMIKKELGLDRFDSEGRILELEFPDFVLMNVYMPHGGREKENMGYKLEAYSRLLQYLEKIEKKNVILIGDFNIAHTESDLARPKDNKNNTMFTPEERKQIDKILELGFMDSFRELHKEDGHYTWWPYFANARARNLGWRLDYVFASKAWDKSLKDAFILPEVMGSDHCPVGIEI